MSITCVPKQLNKDSKGLMYLLLIRAYKLRKKIVDKVKHVRTKILYDVYAKRMAMSNS